MEEKQLNEKESLELISKMIRNTQNRLTGNEGVPFLVWGYATVVVTIAVWLTMSFVPNYYWNFLWFGIPVIGWPLTVLCDRKNKEKGVTTYIDKVISYIWCVLGISCFLVSAVSILLHQFNNILTMVLILMGSGTALTGLIIRFKPLAVCGIIGMIMPFLFIFIPQNAGMMQYLLFAVSFVVMMVIPGHILNCTAHKAAKGEVKKCLRN